MSLLRIEAPPKPVAPAPVRAAASQPQNTVLPPTLRTSGAKD
jgi:hypothetical protein